MTYRFFGGSPSDYAADASGAVTAAPSFTVWTTRTGGSQPPLKDAGGAAVVTVTPLTTGVDTGLVLFQADADAFDYLWLDRQDGSRRMRVDLREPTWGKAANDLVMGGDTTNLVTYVKARSRYVAPTGTAAANTTTLQAAVTDAASNGAPLDVRGAFSVAGAITVPAAATILGDKQTTITQTTSNSTTFSVGANATLDGLAIVGKGTDYVAGTGTPTALGVSVTADNVTVRNCTISNHAGAGIRLNNANHFRCSNTRIFGVSPGQTIPAVDSSCFGVYILTATNSTFTNVEISDCSIGLITSVGCTHLSLQGLKIHDIPGQHGCYIQNATGLNIAGVDVWSINLNGVKLQLNNTVTSDSLAASIANISANNCGDTALTINNIDTALTYKYRALSVANVSAVACGRGLYLGSVRGGTVSNVSVYNCVNDAFTLIDCQNIEGQGWVGDTVGRIGVRFTSATGTVQDRIRLRGLRLHNCGNNNEVNNLYGIYMLQGSNVTLDGPIVTATNGFMQYGLFLSSAVAGDQNTFAMRDAEFSGDTGTSARFQSTVTGVKDWGNNRFSGSILNKPNSVTATVAVP